MKSLLGFLGKNFSTQTENLATEALTYILENSTAARSALTKLNSIIQPDINPQLIYHSQVYGEDAAIPDVVGFDYNQESVQIIEAKFWAGLTDNQPVTYLNRLSDNQPSLLLFLVPHLRMESIWGELLFRIGENGFDYQNIKIQDNIFLAEISPTKMLAIISWDSLLNLMLIEMELQRDEAFKGDLLQLKGLCNELDNDAFFPIQSEEISPMIARRNNNFSDLVDEIIYKGIAENYFSNENGKLRTTYGPYHYGRFFKCNDFYASLVFNNIAWGDLYNTPIWLEIYGKEWRSPIHLNKVKLALSSLQIETPRRLYIVDDTPYIPIFLKTGTEKSVLLNDIMKQIQEVFTMLQLNFDQKTTVK
jgi:hypothetical protein